MEFKNFEYHVQFASGREIPFNNQFELLKTIFEMCDLKSYRYERDISQDNLEWYQTDEFEYFYIFSLHFYAVDAMPIITRVLKNICDFPMSLQCQLVDV